MASRTLDEAQGKDPLFDQRPPREIQRKELTIIYRSGVVVELVCDDYKVQSDAWGDRMSIRLTNADPHPAVLGESQIAAVYEGRIHGAHRDAPAGAAA